MLGLSTIYAPSSEIKRFDNFVTLEFEVDLREEKH